MKKEKSVIDKLISLINKRYKSTEKELDKAYDLSENLALINRVFNEEDADDLSALSEVSSEDFKKIVSLLTKEDEQDLGNKMCAAHFLMVNEIELVEEQIDRLRDLNYRANLKRRNLKKSIEKSEQAVETLKLYETLDAKLKEIESNGVLDNDTIVTIFKTLNIKAEEQAQYLDDILKFNCERFLTLTNGNYRIASNDEIELLELPEEILDIDGHEVTKEDLQNIFKKHHYDLSILNDDLVKLLLNSGNLEQIESVFLSIEKNHIDFIKNDAKHGELLVKFLLESNSELIDDVCQVFKNAYVNSEYLKCYKPVFFPSDGEFIGLTDDVIRKKQQGEATTQGENKKQSTVVGRHRDFVENLKLLEDLGYDRKTLLERQVCLLTMSNSNLIRHLKELKLYEFPIGHEKFPLSALSSCRIMEISDGFIELGEEKYILKYSSRLSAFVDGTLERLYALKKEDMPYAINSNGDKKLRSFVTNPNLPCGLSEEKIEEIVPKDSESILKGNKFNVLLDSYLPLEISEETLTDPVIQSIEERYKVSNWSYNINGILVSRKKLLRNYEFLINTELVPEEDKDVEQILLVSAIYKSKLNMEEIEKVNNGLNSCMIVGGNDGILKK